MKKLKRYTDYGYNDEPIEDCWCLADDVDELEESHQRLEASRAELMEALKEIVQQTDGRNHSILGQDRAYAIARAAIAKAEGTK